MIVKIESDDLSVVDSEPAVIIFSAEWCKTCHDLLDRLNPFSKVLSCKLYNVDIDTNEDLSTLYNVKTLPCVIILKNGKVKNRFDNNFRFQDLFDYIKNL